MLVNRLRASQIKTLPEGKHLDGNGLYLRVVGNSRTWFLRFSFKKKRHDLGLGALSLADARAKAAEIRQQVAEGKHPLVTRAIENIERQKQAITAKGLHTTINDIYEAAFRWHMETKKIRSDKWFKDHRTAFKTNVFPFIGEKPLALITRQDVAEVLRPSWGKSTGSAILAGLRACFKYAKKEGLFTGDFPTNWQGCLDLELAPASKSHKVQHRPACPWKEMPDLYAKAYAQPDSPQKRVALACMLCAPRPGEFVALRTKDVDTQNRIITLMRTKTSDAIDGDDDPWEIPYPTQMDELFDFTAEYPFGALLGRSAAVVFLHTHVGVDYSAHGFRASFSTWCAEHQKNRETREHALHHKVENEVGGSYQRSTLLELRRVLLQEWADYVTSKVHPAS